MRGGKKNQEKNDDDAPVLPGVQLLQRVYPSPLAGATIAIAAVAVAVARPRVPFPPGGLGRLLQQVPQRRDARRNFCRVEPPMGDVRVHGPLRRVLPLQRLGELGLLQRPGVPGVGPDPLDRDPFTRVDLEDLVQKVAGVGRQRADVGRQEGRVAPRARRLLQPQVQLGVLERRDLLLAVLEGEGPEEHDAEEDAGGPDVGGARVVPEALLLLLSGFAVASSPAAAAARGGQGGEVFLGGGRVQQLGAHVLCRADVAGVGPLQVLRRGCPRRRRRRGVCCCRCRSRRRRRRRRQGGDRFRRRGGLEPRREPKVADLDAGRVAAVEQGVVELEVAVGDPTIVEPGDGVDKLFLFLNKLEFFFFF